ncbi:hypothetical protein [Nocardiopsis nanhaiensis]
MRRDRTRRTHAALAGGAALLLLGWPAQALAHGVVLDEEQTDAVRIDAHYDTGEPMTDAQVSVYSPEDDSDPWMTGSVDAEGVFLFEPDETGIWEVEVRQAGHGDTVRVEVAEDAPPEEVELAEPDELPTPGPDEQPAPVPEPEAAPGDPGGGDTASGAGPLEASPLQMAVMGALAVWALVMTALYFARRKRA